MRYCLLAVALLALASVAGAQMLNSCDDLQGFALGQSAKLADSKLQLNTDPKQVTEGKGSVHALSVAPKDATGNTYLSVLLTTAPVDMRGKALVFDAWSSTPDKSKALYVRGYNAKGECVLSWMSWAGPLKGQPVTFTCAPSLSGSGLGWEPAMVKNPDRSAVVKWEFYTGTGEAGAAYDLYLDNLRLEVSNLKSFMDTTEACRLYPTTTLAQEGKAQAILVAPQQGAGAKAAADVAAALEKATGAKFEVRDGNTITNTDLAATNAILIGNVANNRAFLYPYTHDQCFADGVFPGAGGYELRTAQDPWGKGKNLLVVGATDDAGLQAGVQAFVSKLKAGPTLTLDALGEVKLGDDAAARWGNLFTQDLGEAWVKQQQQSAENALATGGHTGLLSQIASVGEAYALTGRAPYAQMFVWLAKRAQAHVETKPDTFGGPWGMDSDFPSQRVLPAWDVVEECPALTPAERLEVSRILFRYVNEAVLPEAIGAASTAEAGHLVSNHGTFANLGAFCAGEYFSKHYASSEARDWITLGDRCFTNLSKGSKVHEDCNGYQWLTQLHIIRYALMKPDLTYFANGNAHKAADLAILTMNNLGYQVPYGDTGAWICWFSELPVLRACEWYYRDGRYQWTINKKVALGRSLDYGQLDPQGMTKEPTELVGAHALPLDEKYWEESGKGVLPLDKAFDKIAFRDGFDPQQQYLLLDGLSNGGHRHMDGNAVLQWTEKDRVWLADADYIKSLPKYHNGVLILKDGQSATIPNYAELENFSDLPHLAASVTTLRSYAGVDWRRHVLWLKGQCFVVADQMVAREPGDYSFRAVWQTVGDAQIKDNGLDINQHGQWARFAMTGDARCLLNDDPDTGKNWSSYPYADKPIVRVFQGVFNKRLKAGERFSLFTVLQASGDKPSPVRVTRVGDNQAVVSGLDEPFLVSLPDNTGKMLVSEGMEVSASALLVSPQRANMIDLTKLPATIAFPLPPTGVDLEIDLGRGSAYIKAPAGVTAVPQQQDTNLGIGNAFDANDVRDFIQMTRATAPAAVPGAGQGVQAPPLKQLWSYRDKLSAYLITNNPDTFEAVDAGLKLNCDPQPLARNVFGDTETNTLDNLTDGVLLTTDGGVMWDKDQAVTLNLEFDNVYDLSRLDLKSWFATSSSKGKTFQLARIQVLASTDGFQKDQRTIADVRDDKTYGNWGAPGYGPQLYSLPDLKAKARQVRLILTPRPGNALYLGELQIWGNRPGLELDAAAQLKRGLPVHVFRCLKMADLNGDQQVETLAGSSNGSVYCFSAKGDLLWRFDGGAPVNCVGAVDYQGDGKLTVLAGVADARLIALDAAGKELWTFRPPYYKRAGHPRTVFGADLQGNGKQTAIVGAENWHYYAVDASGKMVWQYESVHGSTAGTAADLNGDKRDEIIAGTEYYWWHVINPDGSRRFGYSTKGGPCANAVAAGDLLGDGKREAIFGGADTLLHVLDSEGKLLWTFNTGDEVTGVECADVNGDGKDEVIASSLSFNVYCLDGTGKVLWRQDLGDLVREMTLAKSKGQWLVAAGCDSGQVVVLQGRDGKPVADLEAKATVLSLTAREGELLVGTGDGNLTALALP